MIADAYKTTSILMLHSETDTSSLNLFLNSKVVRYWKRLKSSDVKQKIDSVCNEIRRKLLVRNWRRSLNHMIHSALKQIWWEDKWLLKNQIDMITLRKSFSDSLRFKINKQIHTLWKKWWEKWRLSQNELHLKFWNNQQSKIHTDLRKKLSFIITQIQTEKIELTSFLHFMKISEFNTNQCECNQEWETVTHVIKWCRKYMKHRHILDLDQSTTFKKLINMLKRIKTLIN